MTGPEGRTFRVLLRLLPESFRARFEADMIETFAARRAEARAKGRFALALLWARTGLDLLRTAAVERIRFFAPGPLLLDVRLAVRSLARAPLFTLLAGTTIALGIGANTAVFSVVHAVLLRPLPVSAPDELVRVFSRNEGAGEREYFVSPTNYLEIRRSARTLDDIAAWIASEGTILVGADDTPTRANMLAVTWNLIDVLGVDPVIGRSFTESDADPTAPSGVVLTYGTWQRLFGGDPDVTSRSMRFLTGEQPILGVLPDGLDLVVPDADMLVLLTGLEQHPAAADRWLSAVARLSPGATRVSTDTELDAFAASFAEANPGQNRGWGYHAEALDDVVVGEARPALFVLLGAAALVLLIACANVANLLLGRAEGRERDITLRAALGAGRGRLARLLVTESVILAGAGAAAGVLLAQFGVESLSAIGAAEVPRLDEVRLSGSVLLFTTILTVFTGVLFGLAPAARLVFVEPAGVLRDASRGSSGGRGRETLRSAFVVGQLALSVLLVVSAGLLVRNFADVLAVDAGFEPENLITAELTLNAAGYPTYDEVRALYVQLGARARSLPGVEAAGLSTSVPFSVNRDYPVPMSVLGHPVADPSQRPRAVNRMIDEGFVRTMGIEVVAGRDFTALDDESAEGVVLINQAAARTFFGADDPVGQSFTSAAGPFGPLGETQKDDVRVVGVVRDVHFDGLTATPEPTVYFPLRQAPFRRMNVTLRTSADPEQVLGALRGEIRALDGSLPISGVTTVRELVDRSVAQERLSSTLIGIFALLALLLASVGIYGVLSHAVARRMNEIGIRRALGADGQGVARLVLGRTLRLTLVGVGCGLVASLFAGQLLASQLYTVDPRDPLILSGVALALTMVAFVASVAPLVRALGVDPAMALRGE